MIIQMVNAENELDAIKKHVSIKIIDDVDEYSTLDDLCQNAFDNYDLICGVAVFEGV